MTYRFYFEIANGMKKYEDIEADSFRAARNDFFNSHNHLKFYKLELVADITNGNYNVIFKA